MAQLNAFVGHSFVVEDREVVDAFLKYFDQVKGLNIGFSWESAEPAEPRELADKVKSLIKDKNLFIGICTIKEAVIEPNRLSKSVLNKSVLKATEGDFSSKTSDWIIQEIGLAIGRSMDLILLLETGLRQPGGLQGNLEYIPFDRATPEKCFGKLLEMIRALLPKAKAIPLAGVENPAVSEETRPVEEQKHAAVPEPKEDWTTENYEMALFRAILVEDPDGEKRITEAYFDTKDGEVEVNRQSWEARVEQLRITFGTGGKLTRLEELAKKYTENGAVQWSLGKGYEHYEEHEKAAQCFIVAAEKTENTKKALRAYGESILALIRSGQKDKAQEVLIKMKRLLPQVEDGEVILLNALRRKAEFENEKELLFGLTERLLQVKPDDSEARFSLAYSYAEADQNELSFFHYLRIPYEHRSAITWNNLGVQFDRANLVGKSVEAYRRAESLGETLAMSNLAYKFMNAGFLAEAAEICGRAIKFDQYHKNVGLAISKVKTIPDEEQDKEKQILEEVRPLSEFYREFGRAALQKDLTEYEGRWRGPDCQLTIKIRGSKFEAVGDYEVSESGLRLSEVLAGIPASPPKKTRQRVRYTGRLFGYAVNARVLRQELSKPATILGEAMNTKNALLVISDPFREIRVYEKDSGKKGSFYTLTPLE